MDSLARGSAADWGLAVPAPIRLGWRARATRCSQQDPSTGACQPPCVTTAGELLVAQAQPELAQLSRQRVVWTAVEAVASAPGVSLPTTLAALSLYNGEPDTGSLYFIESIFVMEGAGETFVAIWGMGLCHQISVGKQTVPTATVGITPKGSAGQVYKGNAILAQSLTVVDYGWEPWGTALSAGLTDTGVGALLEVPVEGMYIVPPGHIYSVFCLASNGTATMRCGIRWSEIPIGMWK